MRGVCLNLFVKVSFAHKHFEKFKSFMADDGSYGMVLYTPKEYRLRLYTETQQNIGKHILPVIDGLAFDPMEIDQGISDGQLIIWGGLNGYDLRRISETLEAIDAYRNTGSVLRRSTL